MEDGAPSTIPAFVEPESCAPERLPPNATEVCYIPADKTKGGRARYQPKRES